MVAAAAVVAGVWLSVRGGTAPATAARHGAPAPGSITTVAGGVGGPGPATSLPIATCPISVAGDALYAGDGAVVLSSHGRSIGGGRRLLLGTEGA